MFSMLRRRRRLREGEEQPETAENHCIRADVEAGWPSASVVCFWSTTVVTFGYGPSGLFPPGVVRPTRP
jgi:hypothetical protein